MSTAETPGHRKPPLLVLDERHVTAEAILRVVATVFKHSDDDLRDLRDYFLRQTRSPGLEPAERDMFLATARFFAASLEENKRAASLEARSRF